MKKLAAFAWPPGWIEKGQGIFLNYNGVADSIIARSPNIESVVKVGTGIYDVTVASFPSDPGLFAGLSVFAYDSTTAPTLVAISPSGGATRFNTYTFAGVAKDAFIVWYQFTVPAHFAP